MKKLLLFLFLIPVFGLAQSPMSTDNTNNIKLQTVSPLRSYNMFQELIDRVDLQTAGGTDTYTIPSLLGVTSYSGLSVRVKFTNHNTGTSTLNINSLGAKTLKNKTTGANLSANDLVDGGTYTVSYDGTNLQVDLGGGGSVLTNGQGTTANGSAADLGGTISSLRTINYGTTGLILESTASGGSTSSYAGFQNSASTPLINLSTSAGAFASLNFMSELLLQSTASSSLVRLRAYNAGGSGAFQFILTDAGVQLDVANGTDATGDLLVRGSSGRLQPIAAMATGNALISNGVSNVMTYGKIGLTTHVSGNLPLANGGLGSSLSSPASSKILGYDITDATNGYWTVGSNLSYDHTTHTLSAAGGSGGGVSGLTTNRIPYAANSTTLIDDALLTFDPTNKAVIIDGIRINQQGASKGVYIGPGAGNFTVQATSSGQNTGVGVNALAAITDGAAVYNSSNNSAFGYLAGQSITNGFDNSIFGANAGASATVDYSLTAVGKQAAFSANGSGLLTAIGARAGKDLTNGINNTIVGGDAGGGITTGQKNTMIGTNAGIGGGAGTNASYNTVVGSEAGEVMGNSQSNSYFGYISAVYNNGGSNAFYGANTGGYSRGLSTECHTCGGDTFIGTNSGLLTGYQSVYSTALGFWALVGQDYEMKFGSDSSVFRPNYGFGGESYGGGRGVMYLANYTTVPTSAPTGGSFFYSDAGIMKLWNAGAGSGVAIGTGVSFPLSSSQLVINNPANTFAYTFVAAAIGGARNINLPLLAASDEMVTKDFTQTLTNKTLSSNTIGTTQSAGDNSTKLATTAYVDNLTLGPFSTVANGYTNLSGAAGSLLKGDNTWLGIGANATVLTSNGTTFSWAAASGGGITNAAANTEIPLSNGTNLIASTLFYASRTLTLGTAAAGATITLQAAGSATDVGFNFFNKGAGQFQFNGTGSTLANHFFNQVNSLTVNHYSTDAVGPILVLSKLRGTGASPTTDANGDVLGNLDFQGYDGTSTINSARVKAVINGTVATNTLPTDIVWYTTATNSLVEGMRLTSAGVMINREVYNNQTGTTYTFVLTDENKSNTFSNAAAITVTVPPASSVAWTTGAKLKVFAKGAGQVTIAPGAAVTINSPNGLKLRARYSWAELIYSDIADTWNITGDLTP